jgi:hypothetical protein
VACPIPLAAPVIRMIFPANPISMVFSPYSRFVEPGPHETCGHRFV